MDLSRVKLSGTERKFRMDNGLCVACGEKGHTSKDHHRKINPIPIPKRPSSFSSNRNFPGQVKNQQNITNLHHFLQVTTPICSILIINFPRYLILHILIILTLSTFRLQLRPIFAQPMMTILPEMTQKLEFPMFIHRHLNNSTI